MTNSQGVESQQGQGRGDHSRGTCHKDPLWPEAGGQAASGLDPCEDPHGADGEHHAELGFA